MPVDEPPPVPPDLVDEIETLARILAARPDHADIARKFEWLLDALVMRGQIPAELAKRAQKIRPERSTVRLTLVDDKHLKESPDIDCASRLHLCEARCCRFEVALSAQDIRDGLPFDIEQPYALPRDPYTKKCACMDEAGACTVYDKRPASCRVYDCRQDARVWIDFEARIPAPMPAKITSIPKP
jgi:Fe-S-cluster containining protein